VYKVLTKVLYTIVSLDDRRMNVVAECWIVTGNC